MTTIDAPAVPEPAGAHHLDGDTNPTPAPAASVDPELPKPAEFDDRRMAGEIADYALAKLRRYVDGSSEISSHFIELSIRLAEVYARLGEAPPEQPVLAVATKSESGDEQLQFGLEQAEAAIEQLPAPAPAREPS